jgi:hypothetical protein
MIEQESLQEETCLEALEERLRNAGALTPDLNAGALTPDLVDDAIDEACPRVAALGPEAQGIVRRMIEAGALTEAVLRLIELAVPQWSLRRLACEDGEWHCSLSKQPWLPLGFDEIAEATHEILPLAILMALVEARRLGQICVAAASSVPQVSPAEMYSFCCDNYA